MVEDALGREVARAPGVSLVEAIGPPPPPPADLGGPIEDPRYASPDPHRRPLPPGVLLFVACAPSPAEQTGRSGVTSVEVERSETLGSFSGVAFERLTGRVEGQVHRSEPVVGLRQLLGDREFHRYRSEFEVIRPVAPANRRVAVVEVENRGSPLMLQLFNRFVIGFSGAPSQTTYPDGVGDGFLFSGGRSYARVQWQTVISPGVPDSAQGVGEVIVRDFGRLLRSGRLRGSASPLGRYPTLLLTGISQSG